jgi:hypothetical protein
MTGQYVGYPRIAGGAWDAATKLSREFPAVAPIDIMAVLIEARRGVALFGLSRDAEREMTERIARERLAQLVADPDQPRHAPRLDPETHTARRTGWS